MKIKNGSTNMMLPSVKICKKVKGKKVCKFVRIPEKRKK